MADVNVKTIQTRIALKYDSYANWTNTEVADQGANLVLLRGELGICEVKATNPQTKDAGIIPTVLFKVGDGETPFKDLPWASAKAADVYAWAKAEDVVLEGKTIKFVGTDKTVVLNYATPEEVAAAVKVVSDNLAGVDARVVALENKFTGDDSVQGQLNALDGRLDVIEGADTVEGSVAKALKDAKAYADGLAGNYDAAGDAATAEQNAKDYADDLDEAMGKRVDGVAADLSAHEAKKDNPHGVTAEQVGLGKVENKTVAEIKTEFTGEIAADNAGFVTGGAVHTAIEAAKTAANTYADGLNTAMDTRVDALEAAKTAQDTTNQNLAKAIEDEASARGTAITNATNAITSAYEAADLAINNKIGTVAEGKTVVKMIEDAQTAAEGKVTALANGQVETNRAAIAAMDTAYQKAVSDEAKAREDADKAIDERLVEVEAFFKTADGETLDTALDTLVEIQDYLNGDGSATGGIIDRVAQAETDIGNLQAEFNEGGRVKVAEKAIDDVEADLASYKTTVSEALAGKQNVIPANTYDAYGSAADVKTYVDGDFKTAIQGYADGKASAAQTAAEKTASDALATAVQTINAKDEAQDTEIGKKLDKTTFESHTTSDHAKTATEITAEIAAAVLVEENARKAADTAIEEKIGGSYSKTSTVADAIAGVKTTADTAAADLAALTSDSGRIKAAETAIGALQAIVSADGANSNAKLREDITALQDLTGDAAKGNEALHTELTRVAGLVDNTTTGLAATKAIADEALTKAKDAQSRVAAIEADYLKAADVYVFNCGSATTVTHEAPKAE